MKREDLRAIEGLTEEQINQIMRLHGQDETAHQATVQGLQAQLTTAQKGLAAFEGVDVNESDQPADHAGSGIHLQRCAPYRCPGGRRAG